VWLGFSETLLVIWESKLLNSLTGACLGYLCLLNDFLL
jgi:hypothetical protein